MKTLIVAGSVLAISTTASVVFFRGNHTVSPAAESIVFSESETGTASNKTFADELDGKQEWLASTPKTVSQTLVELANASIVNEPILLKQPRVNESFVQAAPANDLNSLPQASFSGSDVASLPTAGSENSTAAAGQTQVTGNASQLAWQLSAPAEAHGVVGYRSVDVQIMGTSGVQINRQLQAGSSVVIDTGNEPLADGLYSWQSTTNPVIATEVMEKLRAVRNTGDIEAQQKLVNEFRKKGLYPTEEQIRNNVQSGHIRIVNGQVVDSTIGEES